MKYIKKIFEAEEKLDLPTEFQSVVDIINVDYGYVDINFNKISVEFFENEIDVDSLDGLEYAESFLNNKLEVIADIKHVCVRLEMEGYHCKLKYRPQGISIEVVNEKPVVDETIQGWLIPTFRDKTEFGGKVIGKQIDSFKLDVRKLKKWFHKEYSGGLTYVREYDRGKDNGRIRIGVKDIELDYDLCKDFITKLKTFTFKDEDGNEYEPNTGHVHLVPKSKYEGVRFNLYQVPYEGRIYSIDIDCNRTIYIDK